MDHRERFFATINYQPVDRPASWLGLPVPSEAVLPDIPPSNIHAIFNSLKR